MKAHILLQGSYWPGYRLGWMAKIFYAWHCQRCLYPLQYVQWASYIPVNLSQWCLSVASMIKFKILFSIHERIDISYIFASHTPSLSWTSWILKISQLLLRVSRQYQAIRHKSILWTKRGENVWPPFWSLCVLRSTDRSSNRETLRNVPSLHRPRHAL